jgi:ASCH domain
VEQSSQPFGLRLSEGLGGAALMLPCLSIRQPWAWLILHGGKDIENRDWPTKRRGRVLVHAANGMTLEEWSSAWEFAGATARQKGRDARLTASTIERGGIVGSVEIVDCTETSPSGWFVGRYGFVLRRPATAAVRAVEGRPGIFRRTACRAGGSGAQRKVDRETTAWTTITSRDLTSRWLSGRTTCSAALVPEQWRVPRT